MTDFKCMYPFLQTVEKLGLLTLFDFNFSKRFACHHEDNHVHNYSKKLGFYSHLLLIKKMFFDLILFFKMSFSSEYRCPTVRSD